MSFEILVDTQDPLWRQRREMLWERRIAPIKGNGKDKVLNKQRERSKRFFMGEIVSPFHAPPKLRPVTWSTGCIFCPHQSLQNWSWFVEQLRERISDVEVLSDFSGCGHAGTRSFAVNYDWPASLELKLFKDACLDPTGGIFAPLGEPSYLRPEYLFDGTADRVLDLLEGRMDPDRFEGEWYELFKRFSWEVADTNVFLPEAGCRGKRSYPLTIYDGPAPDGRPISPGQAKWDTKFTKFAMVHALKMLWFPERAFERTTQPEELAPIYRDIAPADSVQVESLQRWRLQFQEDLANGGFPPQVVALSDWMKVDFEADSIMGKMTYGESIYREPDEGLSRERQFDAKRRAARKAVSDKALDRLSGMYNNSPALSVLETLRAAASAAGLAVSAQPWDGELSALWGWLTKRDGGLVDASRLEQDLEVIAHDAVARPERAMIQALLAVMPERVVGLEPVIKRHGGDPKGNRVYGDLWEFVGESLLAAGECEDFTCKARPVKTDGQISEYAVLLKLDGKIHKFSYAPGGGKRAVMEAIRRSLDEFASKVNPAHQFVLAQADGDEFVVCYLPSGMVGLIS